MKDNEKISEVKFNVLVDIMSAVDIVGVVTKSPRQGNFILYIKTDNLKTVDKEKANQICKKHSDDNITVTFQIPTEKVIGDESFPNTDTVCIYIE